MNGFIETREIYIKVGVFDKKKADKSNNYCIKGVKVNAREFKIIKNKFNKLLAVTKLFQVSFDPPPPFDCDHRPPSQFPGLLGQPS